MKTLQHASTALVTFLFAAAPLAAPAATPAYPERPIRLIVPFAPSGAADIFARIIADKLSAAFGQQVVIDNRGGGGGAIGLEITASARPDGYTLLLANVGPNAIDAALRARKADDPIRRLEPVTQISSVPMVLDVYGGLPARTFGEFVASAKANPGRLTYASAGVGSIAHLTTELFKMKVGVDLTHVPYKGTAPALTDVMAGQVTIMFTTTVSSLPFIKAGKLRALAVADSVRSPLIPDVPTMAQLGVADFEIATWYGIVAPPGTPQPIVARLYEESRKALASPEVKQRFEAMGGNPVGSTPKEFADFLRREGERWATAVKISGARAD